MKKLMVLSTFLVFHFSGKSQSIEVFGGPNFSKHIWTPNFSLANSKDYQTGSHLGIMLGPKRKNGESFFAKIEPHLAFDFFSYKAYNYRELNENTSSASWGEFYKAGLSAPMRIRLKESTKRRFILYGLVSPAYAFTLNQSYQNWTDNPNLASFGDLSVDIGAGTLFQFGKVNKKKMHQSKKYGLSGLSVFLSRSYDLNASLSNSLGKAHLHQYNLTVGLKFSTRQQKIRDFGQRVTSS